MAKNPFRGGDCPLPVVLDHAGLPRGSCPATVAMIDRYPEMTLEYALKLLKEQYGPGSVGCLNNTIEVLVTFPGEERTALVSLTTEQAKFLAANPMSPQDLVNERYPEEWPR
jgi:hypothetical protein